MIRKTATITAASIAGIILAGGAAVGANIGILNSSDDDTLGQLSAEVQPVADEITTTTAGDPAVTETYTVDAAGTVTVRSSDGRLEVGDVSTNDGWAWEDVSDTDTVLMLTFRHPASGEVLDFVARQDEAGVLSARVDRRTASATSTPGTTAGTLDTTPSAGTHDDHGSDDEWDDDEWDDDGHDDDHEDDEHEYEGWDSDD